MVTDIADPYFSSMAAGVEDALSNEDYQVVYGNTSRDPLKEKKFIESVFARKMDGVILTPDKLEEDFVTLLKKLNVRSEEHTSELQSRFDLVCRLLLE